MFSPLQSMSSSSTCVTKHHHFPFFLTLWFLRVEKLTFHLGILLFFFFMKRGVKLIVRKWFLICFYSSKPHQQRKRWSILSSTLVILKYFQVRYCHCLTIMVTFIHFRILLIILRSL